MLCSGRVLALLHPVNRLSTCKLQHSSSRFNDVRPILITKWRSMASDPDSSSFAPSIDSDKNPAGFCIIEGPDTVQDFANMDLQEIQDNIRNRRNKVFLHMEEVRRLRIQQRIKNSEVGILEEEQENELPYFPSFIPFLPPLSAANLKQYYATCFSLIAGIIIFGGLLAPTLELKLGIGGTSYADFIQSVHLPMQLSQVDPIVASFSGGAVGVISALMFIDGRWWAYSCVPRGELACFDTMLNLGLTPSQNPGYEMEDCSHLYMCLIVHAQSMWDFLTWLLKSTM